MRGSQSCPLRDIIKTQSLEVNLSWIEDMRSRSHRQGLVRLGADCSSTTIWPKTNYRKVCHRTLVQTNYLQRAPLKCFNRRTRKCSLKDRWAPLEITLCNLSWFSQANLKSDRFFSLFLINARTILMKTLSTIAEMPNVWVYFVGCASFSTRNMISLEPMKMLLLRWSR